MIAKIRDIGFSPDTIVVGVDCFFELGETGYDNCWIDVPDRPATFVGEVVPTHKVFVPFRSLSLSFPVDVTKAQVTDNIKEKLGAFKRAHTKVAQAQQFVGLEFKV
jgi:hypothetical protein